MISSVQIRKGKSAIQHRAGSVIPLDGHEDMYMGISNSKTSSSKDTTHSTDRTMNEISSWSSRSPRHLTNSTASPELRMNGEPRSVFRKRDGQNIQGLILNDVHRKKNTPVRKSLSVLNRPKTLEKDEVHYVTRANTRPGSVCSESQYSEPLQNEELTESNNFLQRSIAMRVLRAASAFRDVDTPFGPTLEALSGNDQERCRSSTGYRDIKSAVGRTENHSLKVRIHGWQSNSVQNGTVLGSIDSGIDSLEPIAGVRQIQAGSLPIPPINGENAGEQGSEGRLPYNEMSSVRQKGTDQVDDMDKEFIKSHLSEPDLLMATGPKQENCSPRASPGDSTNFKTERFLDHENQISTQTDSQFPPSENPVYRNTLGSTNIETDNAEEEPEYLDSFEEISPLSTRRPSLWNKLRGLGARPLRSRATTSDTHSLASYSSSNSRWFPSSPRSNSSMGKKSKEERCPNCNEVLQKAPLRFFAGKRHEQAILTWILSKWKPRKDLQNFGSANQRGYLPHYCNFVRSKTLHDRSNSPALDSHDGDDDVDDGYITNTDLSPTEADSQRHGKSAWGKRSLATVSQTKNKDKGNNILDGGFTVRATSPSSTGYDPESLFERLRNEGLAESTSALNTSHEGDGDLDNDDDNVKVSTEGLARDETTQTPMIDVRVNTSLSPVPREPIQIPPVVDLDSSRSKKETDIDIIQPATPQSVPRTPIAAPPKPKAKRTPIVVKKKGGKERKKKGKTKEEDADQVKGGDDGEITQVSTQRDDGPVPDLAAEIIVDPKVPDLPSVDMPDTANPRGRRSRASRQRISVPVPKEKKNEPPKTDDTTHNFYDFGDMQSLTSGSKDGAEEGKKPPNYLNDRMVLSLQSSRFELPMDMKSLETMTPQEYLKKYCVISSKRKLLYQKIFQKYKDKTQIMQGKDKVCKAITEVMANSISQQQVSELCNLLEVEEETKVDVKLFSGMAALAERILYPEYLTEDAANMPEYHRERVECADFCALEWKLEGVEVNTHIRKLLESLA